MQEKGHTMGTPRIAVVGSGYWGKNLIRNFHQLDALACIVDTDRETLAAFGRQYPTVTTSLHLEDALADDAIEGIVVATPAETHYAIAHAALLAGKHVFVEKPLVLDEGHGEDLIALADKRERILMVGHLLHYHPAFIKLKQMVQSGEFGRINYIYSNRLNLGKFRREENALWSFAPHDFSMILGLAGEFPTRVQAIGGNYLLRQNADVTMTNLEFPSGLKAHVFVSWLHPFKEQKLVVVGDRKMAVFDDTLPWEHKLTAYCHEICWQNGQPIPKKDAGEAVALTQREPLREECLLFLDCIQHGCASPTDGREGLRVLRVLVGAQKSLERGGESVRLRDGGSDPETPFVHETAIIDPGAVIGRGARIWHFTHVLKNTVIGEKTNVGQNVMIGPDVRVGRGCKIQNNVSVYKGVTLEDNVFCGPSMVFTNVATPRAHVNRMDQIRPTLVRTGATLGANSTIVCGHTVGAYAFVGAGAVVTRDVPDHALMVGNPARRIGWMCACGERLGPDLTCPACGNAYVATGESLAPLPGEKH